jgi:hypothetical protein
VHVSARCEGINALGKTVVHAYMGERTEKETARDSLGPAAFTHSGAIP